MIIMNMKSVFDRWIIILYLFAVLISVVSSTKKNLYTLLGLSSTASQSMIKKAYRGKARDTHPDKNPTMDPLVAAENFREIVEAYETLSDLKARSEYDRTGRAAASQRKNEQNQGGNRNQGFNWGWKFGFNQGSHQERQHGLLFDRIYRTQIIDAQSRVISILSLDHLKSTALAGDDSEFYDEHSIEQRLERYVLLAFYDSSIPACEHRLTSQVLFPWPYAGYSNENYGTSSVWWDEIMLTGKVDLRNKGSSDEKRKLGEYFGIRDGTLTAQNCPSVVLLPRGGYLSERSTATLQYVKISEEFRKFVWPKLKMKIRFENKTPWPLSVWWLDGTRGIKQPEIAVNEATDMNTFLSHSFFFRANWVTGNSLTNQVNLYLS
jgi:curved DNA-binding protein CbpA